VLSGYPVLNAPGTMRTQILEIGGSGMLSTLLWNTSKINYRDDIDCHGKLAKFTSWWN